MDACGICGANDFADGLAKGRHMKSHKPAPETAGAPAVSPVSEPSSRGGAPAVLPEWRKTYLLRNGQRTVKMLRPICRTCQANDPPPNWQRTCSHEPFVSIRQVDVPGVPTVVTRSDGTTGFEVGPAAKEWKVTPNTVEVALTQKVNSGRGVERGMYRKGYLFPHDLGSVLPSKVFPHGIAPACEFRGCFEQTGLKVYRNGTYCREEEAQLVAYNEESEELGALNIDWDGAGSARRRGAQLREVSVTA